MAQEDENPSKKRQDLHRYDAAREDVNDNIQSRMYDISSQSVKLGLCKQHQETGLHWNRCCMLIRLTRLETKRCPTQANIYKTKQ